MDFVAAKGSILGSETEATEVEKCGPGLSLAKVLRAPQPLTFFPRIGEITSDKEKEGGTPNHNP